jgi:hypothetical protein
MEVTKIYCLIAAKLTKTLGTGTRILVPVVLLAVPDDYDLY